MPTQRAGTSTAVDVPLVDPSFTYGGVVDKVMSIPLRQGLQRRWLALIGLTLSGVMMMGISAAWVMARGVGVWGINIPVAWGFAIINFVWWIGIGHAGTLISAILLLLRQEWRTSINRLAEAMTLFAVAMAGLFPLLHLGRFWKLYYLLPYPATTDLWPQWRSPLVWDVIAVFTYGTVSLIFWYIGLVPDLGAMRDAAKRRWVRRLAGFFALGWRGSALHWQRHQMTYLLLAGLATPLVVSVHSIVSFDFSVALVPGWHSTVFPPYFVAGAIYSGFAMVLCITLPLRRIFRLHDLITARHLNAMGKVMLVSGMIVAYGYLMENFSAFLSADRFEEYLAKNRMIGPYGPWFWATLACNVAIGSLLWLRWVRTHPIPLFLVAMGVNVGMWLERYVIVVVSLHRDFMPSAWGMYSATFWDWSLFIGTLCCFLFLLLLFIRFVPMIPTDEIRELLHRQGHAGGEETHTEPRFEDAPPEIAGDRLYGLAAEFTSVSAVLEAARAVTRAGYQKVEAYSPFPVEQMPQALRRGQTRVPLIFLIAGFGGAAAMFALQYYAAAIDYPWNIGGRPLNSWPSFIPLTFEVGVLGAAVSGLIAMLVMNRMPQPYHPLFNLPAFRRVTRDRFFVCIEREDPEFDRGTTAELLRSCGAVTVNEVPTLPEDES